MPSGDKPTLPPKSTAAAGAGTGSPASPTLPCGAKAAPPVSDEEQAALAALGPLEGKTKSEIEATLAEQGYTSVKANSGGKVYTKDLGNDKTMAVRLDPAMNRQPPKGFADEVPHAHKESLPTSAVSAGNYSPGAAGLTKFDDAGQPATAPAKVHIPIK